MRGRMAMERGLAVLPQAVYGSTSAHWRADGDWEWRPMAVRVGQGVLTAASLDYVVRPFAPDEDLEEALVWAAGRGFLPASSGEIARFGLDDERVRRLEAFKHELVGMGGYARPKGTTASSAQCFPSLRAYSTGSTEIAWLSAVPADKLRSAEGRKDLALLLVRSPR